MNIRTLLFFLGMTLFFGCKKNADTVAPGNCNAAQALADKFTAATSAFTADPTNKVKCNAYVDAYKAYADAVVACTSVYTQAQRDDIVRSYTSAKDACK